MNNENSEKANSIPSITVEDVRAELNRVSKNSFFMSATVAIIVVIAITVTAIYLLNSMLLPTMMINGTSMEPTLDNGSIAVVLKTDDFQRGDIAMFYYKNSIMCKRVIGIPGDRINISDEGVVTVNGQEINEPYISEAALGNCNIELPYFVPENMYFVMGDNRPDSDDSRNSAIGCIRDNKMIGRILFCIWPFSDFGMPE